MKKTHKETIEQEVTITDEVICNCCGKKVKDNEEHIHISNSFGYYSDFDMERHRFDLCQQCYKNFIKTFIIEVDVEDTFCY